jgi:hypothetical protein
MFIQYLLNIYLNKRSFYQDRLGTNAYSESSKKEHRLFMQERPRPQAHRCGKRVFLEPFYTIGKSHHFAKTGSGQTEEKR